ncbi:MAG: S-adenosylmethionine:tRNA ribosyltransferase-isomerase, partial [Anaerolineales bacterium]
MRTSDFDYALPPDRIAQQPASRRDSSRLLVMDRKTGALSHRTFRDLPALLRPDDLLVVNVTRVLPARLRARKTGSRGRAEVLLLRRVEPRVWEAMIGGRAIRPGARLEMADGSGAEVLRDLGGSRRLIRFERAITPRLASLGETPLPPYIHEPLADAERYQTVYG